MYTSGVKVPRLGTVQDRILRKFMTMESEKEVAKTNLLALLVANSIPFSDQKAAKEWESKVRGMFTSFMELEYGMKMPENTQKELDMIKFYKDRVKQLKPVLHRDKRGRFTVSGLNSLKD